MVRGLAAVEMVAVEKEVGLVEEDWEAGMVVVARAVVERVEVTVVD